jgi:hypothetical protein
MIVVIIYANWEERMPEATSEKKISTYLNNLYPYIVVITLFFFALLGLYYGGFLSF